MSSTLGYLNSQLLNNCTDSEVVSATARLAGGQTIAPGIYDSVVFVVKDLNHSLINKIGGDVTEPTNNARILGLTLIGSAGGGVAEVYWDRCINDIEAADSIFHESAHLKSEQVDAMHNYIIQGIGGGDTLKVRVLSKYGSGAAVMSWGDIDFYSKAIRNSIRVRTSPP